MVPSFLLRAFRPSFLLCSTVVLGDPRAFFYRPFEAVFRRAWGHASCRLLRRLGTSSSDVRCAFCTVYSGCSESSLRRFTRGSSKGRSMLVLALFGRSANVLQVTVLEGRFYGGFLSLSKRRSIRFQLILLQSPSCYPSYYLPALFYACSMRKKDNFCFFQASSKLLLKAVHRQASKRFQGNAF